jgi:RHS repeat-associated protein
MPGRTLGSGTKEGFTGREQDAETGLDYFGARYYMPALARWTAVDPLAEKHLEWSPYNYVLNNPLVLIDPDGRQVEANLGRMHAFRDNVLPKVGPSARAAGDVAAGLTPYVSTAHDVATLVTGKNQITGDKVGLFGRGVALVGVVTPVSGALLRKGLNEVADAVRRIFHPAGEAAPGLRADFVVTPGGTTVPVSQSRMEQDLDAAGFPSGPTRSPGTEYTLPGGMRVRAMEPSGSAPRRASFENSAGQPVTPDGTVPQPPPGLTPAERLKYVRDRTHVTQTP